LTNSCEKCNKYSDSVKFGYFRTSWKLQASQEGLCSVNIICAKIKRISAFLRVLSCSPQGLAAPMLYIHNNYCIIDAKTALQNKWQIIKILQTNHNIASSQHVRFHSQTSQCLVHHHDKMEDKNATG
jgi:hypothetical protein